MPGMSEAARKAALAGEAAFDLVLEDVDRIEVIRGPGSSVWGSNEIGRAHV